MKVDQSNYKFFRSFRLKTEKSDKISVIIKKIYLGEVENYTNSRCEVLDFNSQGFSFVSDVEIPINSEVEVTFACDKFLSKFKHTMKGQIIRNFISDKHSKKFNYAIKLHKNDREFEKFISKFINKFSKERLYKYLKESCLNTRAADIEEAKEVFSLVTSLYKNFILNEKNKKTKADNIVDFHAIQEQLELDAISLSLIDVGDKFNVTKTGDDAELIYEKINFHNYRMSSFITGKVVSHHIQKNELDIHYVSAPIINKFNNPIGVLEFIKTNSSNQFSFEDEKIIQLMSYILSSQLQSHRPVFGGSVFEHLNPKKIPEGYFYGISDSRFQIKNIISTLFLNKFSSTFIGNKSDREFLLDYIVDKINLTTPSKVIEINEVASTTFDDEHCYIINLENAQPTELNTLSEAMDKYPQCKFVFHTSYYHWLSHQDTYYNFNALNSVLPPFFGRKDDLLEIAEHICRINSTYLDSQVRSQIIEGIADKHISCYQDFKDFVLKVDKISQVKRITNKKYLADSLEAIHNPELSLDQYLTLLDGHIQEPEINQTVKDKKAA